MVMRVNYVILNLMTKIWNGRTVPVDKPSGKILNVKVYIADCPENLADKIQEGMKRHFNICKNPFQKYLYVDILEPFVWSRWEFGYITESRSIHIFCSIISHKSSKRIAIIKHILLLVTSRSFMSHSKLHTKFL